MEETAELAEAVAHVGRRVRDAVRSVTLDGDHDVVRRAGGDDVYGLDARAEQSLFEGLDLLVGKRWPGRLVIEGHDDPLAVGSGDGPWVYLVDPVDGTRPLLAGKRSAWVLIGAGRGVRTLEDLEVGAAVEISTGRHALSLVARADRYGYLEAEDDDLVAGASPTRVQMRPRADASLDRSFVTVVRLLPGGHGPIGHWADSHLEDLEVYDDLYPCTGGQMMGLATGSDAAVFDPRPLFHAGSLSVHPYDMAALVVARAAGVVIEALPPGPLDFPIDTTTPVAWAGYANESIADRLRPAMHDL
ncbi:MAG: hypothetical protein JJLCMIEE_01960 [Acidimicrobiales bacterium]|nr:MAG: hypothetical protein EDR02_15875 [Actinomycetota bacterium]MBV6508893.1 hypothetical protein [Acidimicrobiales bacterium]RIK03944.1 MAG: hypothetical protein DCC48_14655 [Acidobacteriota bacterium]